MLLLNVHTWCGTLRGILQHFLWKRASKHILSWLVPWAVVVALLVERFDPCHRHTFITNLSTNCVIETMKIKKKIPEWPILKKILCGSFLPNSREGQRNLSEYWYLLQCREERTRAAWAASGLFIQCAIVFQTHHKKIGSRYHI